MQKINSDLPWKAMNAQTYVGLDLDEEEETSAARLLLTRNREREKNYTGYKKPCKFSDKEDGRGLQKALEGSRILCSALAERVIGISL